MNNKHLCTYVLEDHSFNTFLLLILTKSMSYFAVFFFFCLVREILAATTNKRSQISSVKVEQPVTRRLHFSMHTSELQELRQN